MVSFTLYLKEIKIAIWLVFSTGLKSGGTPGVAMGVKGVYSFMWEVKVGSVPRWATESWKFPCGHSFLTLGRPVKTSDAMMIV